MHNTILYIAESDARGFMYKAAVVVSTEQLKLKRGTGTPYKDLSHKCLHMARRRRCRVCTIQKTTDSMTPAEMTTRPM